MATSRPRTTLKFTVFSNRQTIISICIFVLCSIMIGIIFGNTVVLMTKINQKNLIYKQQKDGLHSKLHELKTSQELQQKVIEYYEFTWKKNNIFRSINDFSNLSLSLQKDLIFELYSEFIIRCPLFVQLEQLETFKLIKKLE